MTPSWHARDARGERLSRTFVRRARRLWRHRRGFVCGDDVDSRRYPIELKHDESATRSTRVTFAAPPLTRQERIVAVDLLAPFREAAWPRPPESSDESVRKEGS